MLMIAQSVTDGEEGIGAVGATAEPVLLTEKQRELCRRLDELYASANKKDVRASNLFRGALYSMQSEVRKANPDWMAQTAHSLRDLIYPFYRSGAENRKKDVFTQYGTAGDIDGLAKRIGLHFGFLSEVAHHRWAQAKRSPLVKSTLISKKADDDILEEVINDFENVLFSALRRQLDAHGEIDQFIKENNRDAAHLHELLNINFDTRQYFFSTAHEEYLNWLDESGFLEPIRQPVNEASSYSYRTPELDFLSRVAATQPNKAVDVMLSVPISQDRFNPEVLDRFLWLVRSLPAEQLARIVCKIRDDRWPELMARFKLHSFGYERMFQTLSEAKDEKSILVLAEAVLAIKPRGETLERAGYTFNREIFCVRDLVYTKVFQYIANVGEAHKEAALSLVAGCFREVLLLETVSDIPFAIDDHFLLSDKDFFELNVGEGQRSSDKHCVEDLVALLIKLARATVGAQCEDENEARRLYETHLSSVPDSQSGWRVRLVILSLCPQALRSGLRDAFFRIFTCEEPCRLVFGAEYGRALSIGFSAIARQSG